MDSWERFNKTSLPDKEAFYSKLNLKGISDKDYAHAQKVWEVFEIKNLAEYHDLYVQSYILLLAYVFEDVRDKCIEIYKLDPPHFVSAPGLAWQACLKKTGVELELFTDYNKLLMVEEGVRRAMCQAIHMQKQKVIIKTSLSYLLHANNLYGWAMSQKLPINDFKWVKDLFQFNESFIKKYGKNSDKGYIFEVDIEILSIQKIYLISIKIYHFYQKEKKMKNVKSLFVKYKIKKKMIFT